MIGLAWYAWAFVVALYAGRAVVGLVQLCREVRARYGR